MPRGNGDRQGRRRFPIHQEVRYKILYGQRTAEAGTGRTVSMSSDCVLFNTSAMLVSGMSLQLSISWPVLLNHSCPIKLVVHGYVAHSNDKGAAVKIERYEFRTQGRGQVPAAFGESVGGTALQLAEPSSGRCP